VDTREPSSHLQEALKKGTNVDAEYNLPMWDSFREHSENIQGTFNATNPYANACIRHCCCGAMSIVEYGHYG
jgi:hypothetical protein